MNTATLIKTPAGFRGDAKLYRMAPPLEGHEYVVISAIIALGSGPETYVFPADADGEITSWMELECSQRGTLDHEEVLQDAGYTVVKP